LRGGIVNTHQKNYTTWEWQSSISKKPFLFKKNIYCISDMIILQYHQLRTALSKCPTKNPTMGKINSVVNITTRQIVDKLDRAYAMEEAMSGRLVDLCRLEEPIANLAAETQSDIRKMFDKIREDTLRHKEVVMDILRELSRRES
jgi:hypothetical protein